MAAVSQVDVNEWDDILCAEPEKDFVKPNQGVKRDGLAGDDDDDDGWGDVIAIEVEENYCGNLMKKMESFRKQSILCDAIIVIDDGELPCHKNILSAVSPFFKNIFSRTSDPEDNRITLRNLTTSIMDDILHFTYTGEVCIHDGNVRQLVATANFLQLDGLKDMTVSYLERKICPSNAIEILLLSKKHSCDELAETAKNTICDDFVMIAGLDSFRKLTFELLLEFVKSEDLKVMREEEAYEAVINWVNSEVSTNRTYLYRLLQHIRLPLLSPYYLEDNVERNQLIRNDRQCMTLVLEAKQFQLNQNGSTIQNSALTRPRKCMGVVGAVVAIGGWQSDRTTRDVYAYIPSTMKWQPLCPLPGGRYNHAVVVCDGCIYVLGGRNEATRLMSSVLRYDPSENKWTYVSSLPYEIAAVGACNFDRQIFLVGGLTVEGSTSRSYCYNARRDVWQQVGSMQIPRGALSLVADDKYLYAIGGLKKKGTGSEASWQYLDSMEIYNKTTNSWSFGPQLPCQRAYSAASIIKGRIFVIGGQSELLGLNRGLDMFDIASGQWNSFPYLGLLRSMSGAAAADSKMFLLGGMTKQGECVDIVETYDCSTDRWSKIASLPLPVGALQCCCIQLRLANLQSLTTSFSE